MRARTTLSSRFSILTLLLHFISISATVFLVFSATTEASPPDTAWVRTYDGPGSGGDVMWSSTVDPAGNVYTIGWSYGSGTYDDILVSKYDPSGDTLWTYRYNGPSDSTEGLSTYSNDQLIIVDQNGNVYFTFISFDVTDFDTKVVKLLSDGTEDWVRSYDGSAHGDEGAPAAITLDHQGNVIVVGNSLETVGLSDFLIWKIRPNGNTAWIRLYNGPPSFYDDGYSVVVDSIDNVFVSGASQSSCCPGSGWYDVTTIKYDSSGNQKWINRYDGPGSDNDGQPLLRFDHSGTLYAVSNSIGSGTGQDFTLIKYTASGSREWVRRYDGPNSTDDISYSMTFDAGDNIYITGESQGIGSQSDVAIVKYTPDGTEAWVRRYNGTGNWYDLANKLTIDKFGNILAGGQAYNNITGYDLLLLNYSRAGDLLWSKTYSNPANNGEICYSLNVDSSGNIFATGTTASGSTGNQLLIKYTAPAGTATPAYQVSPVIANDLYNIQTADLNRDNYADIVYCGSSDSGLFVAFGDPIDTLSAPAKLLDIANASIAIDYLNGDTLLDIAAVNSSNIYILLNLGNGAFVVDSLQIASLAAPKYYGYGHSAAGDSVTTIATGLIDDDSYRDIIISPGIVISGDGTGEFPTSFTLPFTFETVNMGDFNGDGRDDLIVTSGDQVMIYTNNGSLSFTQASSNTIGTPSIEITPAFGVTDFNRDRQPDFALVLPLTDKVDTSVLYVGIGDGSGGLLASSQRFIDGIASDLSLVDADRDGDLDIAVANSTMRRMEIYYGDGAGGFGDSLLVDLSSIGDVSLVMTSIDLDRDGNPDFISGGPGSGDLNAAIDQQTGSTEIYDEMVVSGYNNLSLEVINPDGFVISPYFRTVAGSEYWVNDVDQDGDLDEESYDFNLKYGRYTIIIRLRPGEPGNTPSSIGIRIDGTQQAKILQDFVTNFGQTIFSAGAGDDSLIFYYDVEPVSSIAPLNGLPSRSLTPTIDWSIRAAEEHPFATAYALQVDSNFFFATPSVDVSALSAPNYQVSVPLESGRLYYWRYAADEGEGYSNFSQTFVFEASGCCLGIRGNANGDPEDKTNITDLTFLVDYLFGIPTGPAPECVPEADVNADPQQSVNISDVTYLVDYLFGQPNGAAPQNCP